MGHKPRLHPYRGRRWCSLCCQLPLLLHLTLATVCTAGQGGGWETLNPDTVAITKHHYSLTQKRGRGLGRDSHAPKQGSIRKLQHRTSRSTARKMASHNQERQPSRKCRPEGGVIGHYNFNIALLMYIRSKSRVYSCTALPPLETIKGEVGHRLETRPTRQTSLHTNTTL